MKRILLVLLAAIVLAAPASAQIVPYDPGTGSGGLAPPVTVHRPADPDQPQIPGPINPWCAGCAAGFTWLCPGCGSMGPKGWQLGDYW